MFSNPETAINQFGLTPTMHVADLGAGIGAYTLPIAKTVGAGRVYALDVQQDLIVRLKNAANAAHIENIEIIASDLERLAGTHLKDASVDVALMANILFQVQNKKGLVQEVKRILKRGGRAIIIDWTDSFGGIGPQPNDVFNKHKATELLQSEGFIMDRVISVGDHHYGIIVKKA